jgi:hypothetical protein
VSRQAEAESAEVSAQYERFPILSSLIGEGWELERFTKTESGRLAIRSVLTTLAICLLYPPDFTEAEAEETRDCFRKAALQ